MKLKLALTILALCLALAPAARAQEDDAPPPMTVTQSAWKIIIERNDIDAARIAVKEPGFDPLLGLPYPFSPLLGEALSAGDIEIAALIVEAAPTDDYLKSPDALKYVGQTKSLPILKLMLAKPNFDPNLKLGDDPLLFSAVRAGNLEGVKALLTDARVDAGARGEDDKTVLFALAGQKSSELTQLLLADKRVDPAAATPGGTTALHEAIGSLDAILASALLADAHVNVNARNDRDFTPLYLASTRSLDMALLLLRDARVEVDNAQLDQLGATIGRAENTPENQGKLAELKKLTLAKLAAMEGK